MIEPSVTDEIELVGKYDLTTGFVTPGDPFEGRSGSLLSDRREFAQRMDGNMIGEVIVIGDLKRRDDAPLSEYNRLAERMYNIVSGLPGFLSVKSFKAAEGEELTVFRFASEEALEAWRTHPEHVETMKRGHAEFYASGFLQICKVIREVGPFEHS